MLDRAFFEACVAMPRPWTKMERTVQDFRRRYFQDRSGRLGSILGFGAGTRLSEPGGFGRSIRPEHFCWGA